MESSDTKPVRFFIQNVISEFKRLQSSIDGSELAEPVADVIKIWDKSVHTSAVCIRNFNGLCIEERSAFSSKESFYLLCALRVINNRDASAAENIIYELISARNDLTEDTINFAQKYMREALVKCFFESISHHDRPMFKFLLRRVPFLVNSRCDLSKEGQSMTPLALAAKKMHITTVYDLIKSGADLNAMVITDPTYGPIPVIFTTISDCFTESTLMIDRFVEQPGFDRDRAIDCRGLNIVFYVIDQDIHPVILDFLAGTFGWKNSIFTDAPLLDAFGFAIVKHNDVCASILTFSSAFDASKADEHGGTYLMLATQVNAADIVKEILAIGQRDQIFNLRPGYLDNVGRTALLCAVFFKSYDALRELVAAATADEINDLFGFNPLSMAIALHDVQSVTIILSHPDTDIQIPYHPQIYLITIYEYACFLGNPQILTLLQQK